MEHEINWFILGLKFDSDVVEFMEYACLVFLHNLFTIYSR